MQHLTITAEEAEQINRDTITTVFAAAEPVLNRRKSLFNEYARKDLINRSLVSDVSDIEVFAPIPKYAVDIASGYFIGKPCKYYSRTDATVKQIETMGGRKNKLERNVGATEANADYLSAYRAILRANHEDKHNIDLAKNAMIHGTAYEQIYTVEGEDGGVEIRFAVLDPKTCIMGRDATVEHAPTCFIRKNTFVNILSHDVNVQYELFTAKRWVRYTFAGAGNSFVSEESLSDDTPLLELIGGLPVIEYPMPDGKCYFEDVLPLIKARDFIYNNLKNTFKFNDEAILVMSGYLRPETDAEMEGFRKQLEDYKTLFPDAENKIEWLIKSVDIKSVGGFFDMLTNDIYANLGMKNPVKMSETYQNITTVRYQNYGMDNKSLALERVFEESLLQGRARAITKILNRLHEQSYDWEVLDVLFERNLPQSLIEEIQFGAQAKASGLLSDVDILDQMSFVEDSDSAHARKTAQDKEQSELMAFNQDMNQLASISAKAASPGVNPNQDGKEDKRTDEA